MKKIILLAAVLFGTFTQAQTITATADGAPISEGQTFTFNTLTEADATLTLIATNVTDSDIYVKLKVNSITNADGSSVQFCFGGQCYFSINEGSTVPTNSQLAPIAPGETNNVQDHFYNQNPGTVVGDPVIYNLSFIEVDANGTELSTLLTFNYKYDSTAGLNNLNGLKAAGIATNTVVKGSMDITTASAATLTVFDINGRTVKTAALQNGYNTVDASGMASGTYMARFVTEEGKTAQVKIVKQ